MSRTIGNVGVLDIRNATEETIGEGIVCENVGVLLYSRQSARLLEKIKCQNIGSTVEAGEELQINNGKVTLSGGQLQAQSSPLSLLIMGQLIIHPDVTSELLTQQIKELHISGHVICPAPLLLILQEKMGELSGKIDTYPGEHTLFERSSRINDAMLSSLPPGAKLAYLGNLEIERGTSNTLFLEKIDSLYVAKKISVFEANSDALAKKLHPQSPHQTTCILDAFEVFSKPVRFDNSDVACWADEHLYFLERVEFAQDVQPSLLEANLAAFQTQDAVYCQQALKPILSKKCDKHKTNIIGYHAQLFTNDGQATLESTQLSHADEALTILNEGALSIGDIAPALFTQKIDKIYNYGAITGPKELMGLLYAKAIVNDGVITDAGASQKDDYDIGNAGLLRL